VVRGNTIYDCGQNGIVGHLGCVFSTIEDNHIYHIAIKREFYGHEIAGIKLHAAIDVVIRHNRIHDTTLGIWLDWQTQGTRVSRNLLYANSRDVYVEVSHGPYLVEHNVFGSRVSLEVMSQGGAFVNNLFRGTVAVVAVPERPTPYHRPHSTQVAGYAAIHAGDDRYIGNVFLGGDVTAAYGPGSRDGRVAGYGTAFYNGHPTSLAAYIGLVGDPSLGDHNRFEDVKQPVYIRDNVYGPGATPFDGEPGAVQAEVTAEILDEGDHVYLSATGFDAVRRPVVTGRDLPPVRIVDAEFEEADGTPAILDVDLTGVRRTEGPAGPLAEPGQRVRIW
jgi:hypothetical protein